jgi:hypothetical protein
LIPLKYRIDGCAQWWVEREVFGQALRNLAMLCAKYFRDETLCVRQAFRACARSKITNSLYSAIAADLQEGWHDQAEYNMTQTVAC